MNKFVRKYPFGSHLLTIFICGLMLMVALIYFKIRYFDISVDTNKRIINVERYVVPDSLIYFKKDTNE
jgi:hypothetical protein